jgi:hypothetical protein
MAFTFCGTTFNTGPIPYCDASPLLNGTSTDIVVCSPNATYHKVSIPCLRDLLLVSSVTITFPPYLQICGPATINTGSSRRVCLNLPSKCHARDAGSYDSSNECSSQVEREIQLTQSSLPLPPRCFTHSSSVSILPDGGTAELSIYNVIGVKDGYNKKLFEVWTNSTVILPTDNKAQGSSYLPWVIVLAILIIVLSIIGYRKSTWSFSLKNFDVTTASRRTNLEETYDDELDEGEELLSQAPGYANA